MSDDQSKTEVEQQPQPFDLPMLGAEFPDLPVTFAAHATEPPCQLWRQLGRPE